MDNKDLKNNIKKIIDRQTFGVFIALLMIWIFFSLATDAFLSFNNLTNVLRQSSVIGIITIAMTMLITSQEFDLSVGSMFALSGVVLGVLTINLGLNIYIMSY